MQPGTIVYQRIRWYLAIRQETDRNLRQATTAKNSRAADPLLGANMNDPSLRVALSPML